MPTADPSHGRRRSPSINKTVWPESEAVIARHEAIVDLPSFGWVLVTKIDRPDSKAPLSRIPLGKAAYASRSSGVSDTRRASALRRHPSLARCFVNATAGKDLDTSPQASARIIGDTSSRVQKITDRSVLADLTA